MDGVGDVFQNWGWPASLESAQDMGFMATPGSVAGLLATRGCGAAPSESSHFLVSGLTDTFHFNFRTPNGPLQPWTCL